MNASIAFSIPGVPVAKGRPRFTRTGHTYTPNKTAAYERLVSDCAKAAMGSNKDALVGGLAMMLAVYMPIPKSWAKARREDALAGSLLPVSKPDLDNVAKSISDALNGLCYFDYSQLVDLFVSKRYSAYPRVDVEILSLGGVCVK